MIGVLRRQKISLELSKAHGSERSLNPEKTPLSDGSLLDSNAMASKGESANVLVP